MNSQNVVIYAENSNIKHYCSEHVYIFEFGVKFSEKLDKTIAFEMDILTPKKIPFKCVIDGPQSKILCFHSFSNYIWSIKQDSKIELPYLFPTIEGITWDYDTFLRFIYRYLWKATENCGRSLPKNNEGQKVNQNPNDETEKEEEEEDENEIEDEEENHMVQKEKEIKGIIDKIYNGECHSSKLDYSFKMNMQFNEGEIVEELKNSKNSGKNMKFLILHEIYVPILLGVKKQKGTTHFQRNNEYKYAKCKYESEINQNNFDNSDGLIFDCHIPVNKVNQFKGPLQIRPFNDYSYISLTGKDGKLITKFIGIDFDILPSNNNEEEEEIEEEEEEEEEEKELEKEKNNPPNTKKQVSEPTTSVKKGIESVPLESKNFEEKKPEPSPSPSPTKSPAKSSNPGTSSPSINPAPEGSVHSEEKPPAPIGSIKTRNLSLKELIRNVNRFLILDSNVNIFICPDKPILTIKNYEEGINFGGISASGKKFLFLLYGSLSNGIDYVNDTLTDLDVTKEEIKFELKITDNLEVPDLKKKSARCVIPSGTSINKDEEIEIKCIGNRAKVAYNNTDLLLNWNLPENNNFEDLIVKWPYDLTHKKHIFFYNVEGLSVKKEDYGCFENKYFFYLYVYDLKAEPKISFNLPILFPLDTKAECKLYNSMTFKCVIDLRLKKLLKGSSIALSNDISQYLYNSENNIVLYHVNNETSSPRDFLLTVDETCGDFALVGALKDVGYSYVQIILIIIGCIAGLIVIIFGISFCVIYEITHRNRKGPHFRFTQEKELPNTSVSQTQPPV